MALPFVATETTLAAIAAALAADDIPDGQFPDFPPRDDMQNTIYLNQPGHQAALMLHFGAAETTLVHSEIPLGWQTSDRAGLLVPDLMIAFGVDRADIIAQNGYSIDVRGKPPEFVLEIASVHTALNDERGKRIGYAEYGVPEYWRFDPTGGARYRTGLAGDALTPAGDYQPIAIHQVDADRYWGHSEVLNLDICWEYGQLRWYDPVGQRYLLTHHEEAEGRRVAELRVDLEYEARTRAEAARAEAELRADAEQAARAEAELRADAEQAARADAEQLAAAEQSARADAEANVRDAEQRADAEQAARADAEARLRELQAELERLRNQ